MTAQTQPAQQETQLQAEDELSQAVAKLRALSPGPTVQPNSQDWSQLDPVSAWMLINRHADNWADTGMMMQEYVDAQKLSAVQRLEARVAELREMLLKECQHSADQKLRADQMTEQHRMQAKMNSEARAELAQLRESKPQCEWTYNDEYFHWNTGCGNAYQFTDGGIKENSFTHCPYCGGGIGEKTHG